MTDTAFERKKSAELHRRPELKRLDLLDWPFRQARHETALVIGYVKL
jgi:hypothetical protein